MKSVGCIRSIVFSSLIAVAVFFATASEAQLKVRTVAGGAFNDGKPATSAALAFPESVAVDTTGNLYISDFYNHRLRKVGTDGVISTIAGDGLAGFAGDGGPSTAARLNFPRGLTIDSNGNLFLADSSNNRVRKIDTSGNITTVAGSGISGYSGDGGPATSARLNHPFGLFIDNAGNLYIADYFNEVIRMVDTAGNIHTVAGNGHIGFGGNGGLATLARLNHPRGVAVDASGNLYIADTSNHRVRVVDPVNHIIRAFAGSGSLGCSGDGGQAIAATIGEPRGLAISGGTLLISNGGCGRVRAVNLSTRVISTFAGSFPGYDGDGHGPLATQFSTTTGIAFDNSGNLLVADSNNSRIRKVKVTATTVNTVAGGFTGDGGAGTSSALNAPENIGFDKAGNLYIADANANRIRKLTPSGIITTIAGTGVSGYTGDGGLAKSATLFSPFGVAADSGGNVFIADGNHVIRRVDKSTKNITTFATDDFAALSSMVIIDSANNIYVADQVACVVWKITPAAVVSTVAGTVGTCGYNSDGISATTALLKGPFGVALDTGGNLYIGDTNNSRIRKVDNTGTISTVAGNGVCGFSGNGGNASAAVLCHPQGVATDSAGNLYIADFGNGRIRIVNSAGIIKAFAGSGSGGYNGDGLDPSKTDLDGPVAVAVNPVTGVVYLDDDEQYRIRRLIQ